MQIELVRTTWAVESSDLPPEFKPYRILYWFGSSRIPVVGQLIYLPSPKMAKEIEESVNAVV